MVAMVAMVAEVGEMDTRRQMQHEQGQMQRGA